MGEPTKQLGLRIPADQYNKLQYYARSNDISLTELIINVFDDFLNKETPGLCPECHTQNQPNAKYCSQCGLTLDNVKRQNTIEELQHQINEMQRRIDSLESYKIEQVGSCIRLIQDKKKNP